MRVRVLQRVQAVLDRDLPADVLGRAAARDVRPDERGERAAGAERGAAAAPERELRVALGLLLEGDREDTLVLARLHVRGRDDRGGTADGTRGVHPEHGLADRAERVGEVELGLHDPFEEVGSLADDDRVDVGKRHLRVVERRGTPLRARARRRRRPGDVTCGGSGPRRRSHTARRSRVSLQDADEVLLQARSRRRMGRGPAARRRTRGRRRTRCGRARWP